MASLVTGLWTHGTVDPVLSELGPESKKYATSSGSLIRRGRQKNVFLLVVAGFL